ncbi:MAG: hypothetical protein F9K40_10050, partial [Kofleriaceae bacterium]
MKTTIGILVLVLCGISGCGFGPGNSPGTDDGDAAATGDVDAADTTATDARTSAPDAPAPGNVAPGGASHE